MDKAQVYQALKVDHWDHVHNWEYVEAIIEKVCQHTGCSVAELRQMMREIERKYLKPKPKEEYPYEDNSVYVPE